MNKLEDERRWDSERLSESSWILVRSMSILKFEENITPGSNSVLYTSLVLGSSKMNHGVPPDGSYTAVPGGYDDACAWRRVLTTCEASEGAGKGDSSLQKQY